MRYKPACTNLYEVRAVAQAAGSARGAASEFDPGVEDRGEDVGWRAVLGTRLRLGPGLAPDRAPEGAPGQADRAVREGDAGQREALGRRAALPEPQLRDPGRERVHVAHRAGGVRRAGREPRGVRDGVRDAGPLRLRLHRHVLRDAHQRGGHAHAAPDAGADRQVHPAAQRRQGRARCPTRTRRPAPTSGIRSPPAPSARTAATRSTRRPPGRPPADSPTSTSCRPRARTSRATTTCRYS